MNLLPTGLFRRVTPIIQVSALCLTLVALFAYPKGISLIKPDLPVAAQNPWLWKVPQLWFLGLAQTIAARPEPVWSPLCALALKGSTLVLAEIHTPRYDTLIFASAAISSFTTDSGSGA